MKKLFTLFTLVLMAVSCFATDYTDELIIDGKSQGQKTVSVNKQTNGKYKIELKNFSYERLDVGTITLTDVEGTDDEWGNTVLTTTGQNVKVTVLFVFSMIVPVDLNGKIIGDKFYADITIHDIPNYGTWKATFAGGMNATTGITNLPVDNDSEKIELYNLSGQRISEAKPGQVVIEKRGNKVVKKVVK